MKLSFSDNWEAKSRGPVTAKRAFSEQPKLSVLDYALAVEGQHDFFEFSKDDFGESEAAEAGDTEGEMSGYLDEDRNDDDGFEAKLYFNNNLTLNLDIWEHKSVTL